MILRIERTSTRKKDVEGLSCGFEDILIHNDVSIKLKTRARLTSLKKTKKHKSCNVDFAKNKNTCIFAIANVRIWS